jgi:molybdate transport system regulatory protein
MSQNLADPTLLASHISELADKRIDILRRIGDVGSISEAARRAGVSYKAAWQAIETLSNLAGGPLVEKTVGGSKGGGTKLSAKGLEVLKIADDLTRARAEVLARYRLREKPGLINIGVSTLRTSMRNQLPATIEKMKIGSALVRLILRVDETHLLRASVTMESSQLLGLREGLEVLALTKATAVTISADSGEAQGSAKMNILTGTVLRCEREDKGGECTLQLPSGITVVGFAKSGHGLRIGMKAVAAVSPSAIVIALNS